MDKRLAKRHKRQVTRAKQKLKLSEPDLRTPEEIKTARETSRASIGGGSEGANRSTTPSSRSKAASSMESAARTAV